MTPILNAPRPRGARLTVAVTEYGFQISDEIERRMRRCRAPLREAIQKRLAEIATSAGQSRRSGKTVVRKEPALRFYVYEGYRIAYQLDAGSRRVVVLDIQLLPVD
jgi:mRNA-degrading endonuclease RelE of RelBE toxin-antitoxin system